MPDETIVDDPPLPFRDDPLKTPFCIFRIFSPHPAETVGDAVHMSVHRDGVLLESIDQNAIGDFSPDARQ